MNSAPDEPRPPRSSTLSDLAAARDAASAAGVADRPPEESLLEPAWREAVTGSSCLLVLGVLACLVLAVVAFGTGNLAAGVVGLLVLGVAAAALLRLYRQAGKLGRIAVIALGGLVLLVTGLMLGIQSYDEKYFGDPGERGLWDVVSWIGLLLAVVGLVATVGALLTLLVAAIVVSVRGR